MLAEFLKGLNFSFGSLMESIVFMTLFSKKSNLKSTTVKSAAF